MRTEYAKMTGSAAALLDSILCNGLDAVNRQLAIEWLAQYNAMHEDPEHAPIRPSDESLHYNRLPCGCPLDSYCDGFHAI